MVIDLTLMELDSIKVSLEIREVYYFLVDY